MMTIDCCNGCTERYPACWGSRPKYQEARKAFNEKKDVNYHRRKADIIITSVQYNGLRKAGRKRKEP